VRFRSIDADIVLLTRPSFMKKRKSSTLRLLDSAYKRKSTPISSVLMICGCKEGGEVRDSVPHNTINARPRTQTYLEDHRSLCATSSYSHLQ
jgi:hypothetical protein